MGWAEKEKGNENRITLYEKGIQIYHEDPKVDHPEGEWEQQAKEYTRVNENGNERWHKIRNTTLGKKSLLLLSFWMVCF